MVALSPDTEARVEALFDSEERFVARALLENECANNLPFCEGLDSFGLERMRFAVLKLSAGKLDRLRHEINQAKLDWRDTLMAAGFGDDVNAHQRWFPAGRR